MYVSHIRIWLWYTSIDKKYQQFQRWMIFNIIETYCSENEKVFKGEENMGFQEIIKDTLFNTENYLSICDQKSCIEHAEYPGHDTRH